MHVHEHVGVHVVVHVEVHVEQHVISSVLVCSSSSLKRNVLAAVRKTGTCLLCTKLWLWVSKRSVIFDTIHTTQIMGSDKKSKSHKRKHEDVSDESLSDVTGKVLSVR